MEHPNEDPFNNKLHDCDRSLNLLLSSGCSSNEDNIPLPSSLQELKKANSFRVFIGHINIALLEINLNF